MSRWVEGGEKPALISTKSFRKYRQRLELMEQPKETAVCMVPQGEEVLTQEISPSLNGAIAQMLSDQ